MSTPKLLSRADFAHVQADLERIHAELQSIGDALPFDAAIHLSLAQGEISEAMRVYSQTEEAKLADWNSAMVIKWEIV